MTSRWVGPKGAGYSSPQLATIDGVEQVIILNGIGAVSVDPAQGRELWKYEWSSDGIIQPAVLDDGSFLISGVGSGMGGGDPGSVASPCTAAPATGRPNAAPPAGRSKSAGPRPASSPSSTTSWCTKATPTDSTAPSSPCIDLADGARKWKGGRFGNGQLLVLADQDLLLVLSEKGELALVDATPGQFTERARSKAIDGKTWNHPALAGDVLLVRNSAEMAAFRLKPAGG